MRALAVLALTAALAGCYTMPTEEEWLEMSPEQRAYHELKLRQANRQNEALQRAMQRQADRHRRQADWYRRQIKY